MSSKFFTNQDKDSALFKKFVGIFENNPNIRLFDVLVGYFCSSGYFKIQPYFKNLSSVRILVGINIDNIALKVQNMGTLFKAATPEQITEAWEKLFLNDVGQAIYSEEVEKGIMQFVEDIKNSKVQVRVHPSKNIHAKIYIFCPENFNQHNSGNVITGSSNLTDAGLGTSSNPNYEFNVLLNDYPDVKFASDEFENLWQEGVEISADFVTAAQQKTYLQDITPYELYLKTLIEYFGKEIEFDPNSVSDLPNGFKRLDYQMDAVYQAYQMLEKHNGCFLADVVGLGKTIIATLIIRLFFHQNGYPDYRSKILLIVPPALKDIWRDTLRKFSIADAVTIVTNGSLDKVTDHETYDMVVVDEAHKFRNNTSQAYEQMQLICKTPAKRNGIETHHIAKKVILISATPQNNSANDIYNQMLLFQDGNQSTLGFSLSHFFSDIDKKQKAIRKYTDKEKARKETILLSEKVRETAIEPVMVRRTRTDLIENKRYKKDLKQQGITFPEITKPQAIYYQLPPQLEKLFDSTLEKINSKSGLQYMRYRALEYLVAEKRAMYAHAKLISNQLAAIMKTLLLKRMDSSFVAFKGTLDKFLSSSQVMMKMIENNRIIIAPNIDIGEYILNDNEEELLTKIVDLSLTDPTILICTCDDFEHGFISGIKHDHEILTQLVKDWEKVTEDPKLDTFNDRLDTLLDKNNNPEQKLIIFTESKDTMLHLEKKIKHEKILGVSSINIANKRNDIKINFDANIPLEKQRATIDVLITTDILAEGINLHRANTVINYDTPWNATRLMQRIGRVNRIGTKAEKINIYNFRPTAQVDSQIELEKKAALKLQAFHSALGEDSQIYSDEELVGTFSIFDADIEAERSATLPYSEEIRQLRKDNPELYNKLKNMPPKVRNAVTNKQQQGKTLAFMRTENKGTTTFSLVQDANTIESYPFTKAIKLLKASPDVKGKKLPTNHHQQVNTAIEQFENTLTNKIIEQYQAPQKLSPKETKAINFMKSLQALPSISETERNTLNKTIMTMRNKVYRNLALELEKLSKNTPKIKLIVLLEKALTIISKYSIDTTTEPAIQTVAKDTIKPAIIISQSYV